MGAVPLNVNVDSDLKEQATLILESVGLTRTTAVVAFLKQVIFQGGMPFELKNPNKFTPNQLTLGAIEQLESGKGNHADTVEEFLKEVKTWK